MSTIKNMSFALLSGLISYNLYKKYINANDEYEMIILNDYCSHPF